ncbi:MAG: PTPA-CTERM sorting domain-containing protein [Bacteroidetes bacterium]|nr:PTPA-CTERM sorting domain-containing protein [Bacteroidota bacterium]
MEDRVPAPVALLPSWIGLWSSPWRNRPRL